MLVEYVSLVNPNKYYDLRLNIIWAFNTNTEKKIKNKKNTKKKNCLSANLVEQTKKKLSYFFAKFSFHIILLQRINAFALSQT